MKESLKNRVRIKRIKQIACELTCANVDVFNIKRRKYMVETKRLAAWLFWYYTDISSSKIGEYLMVDHATIFWSVRKLNQLIETEWKVAAMVIKAEKKISSFGMNKKNRIAKSTRKENMDYAVNYKKENIRPVPTTKKVDQILLLSNDKRIMESILKRKKQDIELLNDVDKVREMAKEIADIERSIKTLR